MGYGGMIHNFKNVVLRHDHGLVDRVEQNIDTALQAIKSYEERPLNAAERAAIEEIRQALQAYYSAVRVVESLAEQGLSPTSIDQVVKVDDGPALEAFDILTREIALHREAEAAKVDEALTLVDTIAKTSIFVALAAILALVIGAIWLIRSQIIGPIAQMTNVMTRIAAGELGLKVTAVERKNEIGEMARALVIFRDTAIEREKALQDREEQMRAIVNTVVDGIVTIDTKGTVETFNPAAERIFGYAADEVIGQNVKLLMPNPYHDAHDGYLSAYIETDDAKIIGIGRQVQGKRKDGTTFSMELAVSEMEAGGRRMFTGIVRDITRREQAEQGLRQTQYRLSAAIENVPGGFLMVDSENHITLFNHSYQRLYPGLEDLIVDGASIEDVIRAGVERGVYAAAKGQEDAWLEERLNLIKSEEFSFEDKLADGRWIAEATREMVGGAKVSIFTDITELKNAKEEAEKASRAKSEFLSSMSHELRTPMNAILGFGQLLQGDGGDPLSEEQTMSVDQIVNGGQHLMSLINMVLDLASVESGNVQISLDVIPLEVVCRESLELIRDRAMERGIRVAADLTAARTIRVDTVRIKQIILNLLSNAAKYGPENGAITLRSRDVDNNRVRLSISDTGSGIPEDLQARLFEPFDRLGREGGVIEGTGIGLTITKQLVDLMDGEIGYEFNDAIGSTFWVEFPAVQEEVAESVDWIEQSQNSEALQKPSANPLVLYIEDNPANLNLMKSIISRMDDLTMISAHNAELGLIMAKEQRPDLILMDINLPGMDGFAAMAVLGEMDETKNIPVIAISANAMKKEIKRGMEVGFKAYLTKPVNVRETIDSIKKALGARGSA
ncbi:MAG: PAS domain S-box protein [Proteobacteria bacterium]|nr:PAS domain S-box protein [Pseudomonadota bacterium]